MKSENTYSKIQIIWESIKIDTINIIGFELVNKIRDRNISYWELNNSSWFSLGRFLRQI